MSEGSASPLPGPGPAPLAVQTGPQASVRRIGAMILRHWYVIRASGPRALEIMFWPMLSMLMWGFLQGHLARTTNIAAHAAGLFMGGVLLWEILARGHLGLAVAFLEEIWSRNLGHLMMSPLRSWELAASLMAVSLIKILIAMIPVTLAAHLFFGFNLLSLGPPFALFFVNLTLFGWSLGLVSTGAVLRWGLGAESLAWMVIFIILPVACVYYPVASLPDWLQPVALALPVSHVFEGLRALVLEGVVRSDVMLRATVLNAVYLAAAYAVFHHLLESARRTGTLVQIGE